MSPIVMTGKDRDGMLSLNGIMLGRFVLSLTLILAGSLFAYAADPKILYDRSTDALYNLDFSTAQQGYETLTHDYPANPDYWNALAASIWLRIMYEQQKLNIESFAGDRLGTKDSQDVVTQADERRLREILATSISKADAM